MTRPIPASEYVLQRLLSPWQMYELCARWDADFGQRHVARSHCGYAGTGVDGVWLSACCESDGVHWQSDLDSVTRVVSWREVREVLRQIPAPKVAALGDALRARQSIRGICDVDIATARQLVVAETAAFDACWDALRAPVGQLELFDLAGVSS